jgi:hypothetical protein
MLVICLPVTLLYWVQSAAAADRQDLHLIYATELEGERGDALTRSMREFGRYGENQAHEASQTAIGCG